MQRAVLEGLASGLRAWRAIPSRSDEETKLGNATLCFPVGALVHRESLAAKPAVGNCARVRFRGMARWQRLEERGV